MITREFLVIVLALLGGCGRSLYGDFYTGNFYARTSVAEVVTDEPAASALLIGESKHTGPLDYRRSHVAIASAIDIGANVVWLTHEYLGDSDQPSLGAAMTAPGQPGVPVASAYTFGRRVVAMYEQRARFYRDKSKPGLENSPDVVTGHRVNEPTRR